MRPKFNLLWYPIPADTDTASEELQFRLIDLQSSHSVQKMFYAMTLREIGSRVGRNQTTVIQICDRWMQEGTTDQRDRSHPPQCTTSREDRQIVRMAVTDRSVTSRTVAQHIESVTDRSFSVCA
ncbi:transposable element Tcb1 transposase [Trichonephila clavipes]|nr:transposable element Tcb1 transposase [Trichonephila clavipes]